MTYTEPDVTPWRYGGMTNPADAAERLKQKRRPCTMQRTRCLSVDEIMMPRDAAASLEVKHGFLRGISRRRETVKIGSARELSGIKRRPVESGGLLSVGKANHFTAEEIVDNQPYISRPRHLI
jgi:hypothetical protein